MAKDRGLVVMTSPDHYEIAYTINPWMRPREWHADNQARARLQWQGLRELLIRSGLEVVTVPGVAGLPDMVFAANGAIVLDRRALVARFRHPERQGEEAMFLSCFNDLQDRGLLDEVAIMPPKLHQEGAGDCLWDDCRQIFWAGYGPRSSAGALAHVRDFFGRDVIGLELVGPRYCHLDTCLCVLPGGEVLYFPDALSSHAQATVQALVPSDMRFELSADEAATFCLNALCVGRHIVTTNPPARLRERVEAWGYTCIPMDLSCFNRSGGGAGCLALRLDRQSLPIAAVA